MKKKIILSFLFLVFVLFNISSIGFCENDQIKVFVNSTQLQFETQPFIENERTLVPIRTIFESLNAKVDWDDNTRTITAVRDNKTIKLQIGSDRAYIDNSEVILDVPAKIVNEKTFVPLRFVSEAFGSKVDWDGDANSVFIQDNNAQINGLLKVHFIDVGQADSILIQTPGNKVMLIDAGNNSDGSNVVSYIRSLNINKIDVLIGTHPHEDHIGGMDNVINTFDIGQIYMPKVASNTKTFEDVLTSIKNKGLTIKIPTPGSRINLDPGLDATVLAPNSFSYDDLNNYSIVVKLVYNKSSFLFTGDAQANSEQEMLSKGYNLKSDVLKVGHHGSDTSTSSEFLKAVSPKCAIISVGKDNDYGHPKQETLDKLSAAGVQVYRTDESGTITATSDGFNITLDKNATVIQANAPPTDDTSVAPEPTNAESNDNTIVYITKTGTKYHVDGCSSLSKSKIPVTLKEAKAEGYAPCSKCDPPQ